MGFGNDESSQTGYEYITLHIQNLYLPNLQNLQNRLNRIYKKILPKYIPMTGSFICPRQWQWVGHNLSTMTIWLMFLEHINLP